MGLIPGVGFPGGANRCGSIGGVPLPCDWEALKCHARGLKDQTACKTVDVADLPAFRRHELAPWILNDRVDDVISAWNLPVGTNLSAMGVDWGVLADMHLNSVVPTCLGLEAGRHTCHPEADPGALFYKAAREQFRDDLKNGKLRWRAPARGGTRYTDSPPGQGQTPSGNCGGGRRDAEGNAIPCPPDEAGGMGVGFLVVAAIAFLALKGS